MTPRDEQRLRGVHADLAWVIRTTADAYSPKEFIITEGLRNEARQAELVAAGASQTMNSRHLTGHAVDVAVKVGAEVRWELHLYTRLAEVVGQVAKGLGIPVIWGGCWVRVDGAGDLDDDMAAYIAMRKRQGKKPFIDGAHFELDRSVYP